ELQVNNRKLLAGLAEVIGKPDQLTDITIAIDKLDKIGLEGVRKELQQRGLADAEITAIEKYLAVKGSNQQKLEQLARLLKTSAVAERGIAELQAVLQNDFYAYHEAPVLTPTLARGLNCYTGTILEAKAPATVKIGSIGGG